MSLTPSAERLPGKPGKNKDSRGCKAQVIPGQSLSARDMPDICMAVTDVGSPAARQPGSGGPPSYRSHHSGSWQSPGSAGLRPPPQPSTAGRQAGINRGARRGV